MKSDLFIDEETIDRFVEVVTSSSFLPSQLIECFLILRMP